MIYSYFVYINKMAGSGQGRPPRGAFESSHDNASLKENFDILGLNHEHARYIGSEPQAD